MSKRKNKTKTEPELCPGEINQLSAWVLVAMTAKANIAVEIDRLEKLRRNPTFPTAEYTKEVNRARIAGLHLQNCSTEVKL